MAAEIFSARESSVNPVNARGRSTRGRSVDGSSIGQSVGFRANGVTQTSEITALKRGTTEGMSGNVPIVYAKTSSGHVISRSIGERNWQNTRWSDEPNYSYKRNGRTIKNPF